MIKKLINFLLSKFLIKIIKNFLKLIELTKYKQMSNQQIFKDIYEKKLWSPEKEKSNFEFYSGTGSHYKEFKSIYLNKVIVIDV